MFHVKLLSKEREGKYIQAMKHTCFKGSITKVFTSDMVTRRQFQGFMAVGDVNLSQAGK